MEASEYARKASTQCLNSRHLKIALGHQEPCPPNRGLQTKHPKPTPKTLNSKHKLETITPEQSQNPKPYTRYKPLTNTA